LQTGYVLRIKDPYRYASREDPVQMLMGFSRGNIEQQGRIFEDYVRAAQEGQDDSRFALIASYVRSAAG
jgi:hypothetical protein